MLMTMPSKVKMFFRTDYFRGVILTGFAVWIIMLGLPSGGIVEASQSKNSQMQQQYEPLEQIVDKYLLLQHPATSPVPNSNNSAPLQYKFAECCPSDKKKEIKVISSKCKKKRPVMVKSRVYVRVACPTTTKEKCILATAHCTQTVTTCCCEQRIEKIKRCLTELHSCTRTRTKYHWLTVTPTTIVMRTTRVRAEETCVVIRVKQSTTCDDSPDQTTIVVETATIDCDHPMADKIPLPC